jgi:hypothetical protein
VHSERAEKTNRGPGGESRRRPAPRPSDTREAHQRRATREGCSPTDAKQPLDADALAEDPPPAHVFPPLGWTPIVPSQIIPGACHSAHGAFYDDALATPLAGDRHIHGSHATRRSCHERPLAD